MKSKRLKSNTYGKQDLINFVVYTIRTLELGAGAGLPSLVALLRGASVV